MKRREFLDVIYFISFDTGIKMLLLNMQKKLNLFLVKQVLKLKFHVKYFGCLFCCL